ncbi:major facilitator superfamily transporter [Aspergillus heteromorphus CBS 117.55]|uniref:Major facilitator superfamily transporter n=1 Tax=Aspergillus heteromorphus CBS 117.55 TaxID=1448321 RepID=A0A317VL36_9EURO|nr:major facilitator superfamily transporter [Aspergillus heteromorphus CBS 117.55]PWY75104.1 major facilitator superfamily transporter [Aspergillus heteromorphus CBS 117.55]
MRILCRGIDLDQVFEIQTAAIRYELGDNHVYDFVEGTVPARIYPGVELISWKDEPMYAYFDDQDPDTGLAAYRHLEQHLCDEGPYDGVIAFSQAGTMILTYLIHLAKRDPRAEMPFRFAIILSITHPPLDYEALQEGRVECIDLQKAAGIIPIPSAHIWGSRDEAASKVATSNNCNSIALSLFLATAEITIISTSLVTIGDHLVGREQGTWIITSYLLTFTGFLASWAKFSDVFGLRIALLSSVFLFIAFSGGCGAAQNIDQLIIFRALQGIGGSGAFSLCLFGLVRIVPPERFDTASAVGSGVLTFALILGSLIGGGISSSGAWRWIFLFKSGGHLRHAQSQLREFLIQADSVGCVLLLAFSMLLVAALEEAKVRYAWSSGLIIGLLTGSGVLCVAFLVWELLLSRAHIRMEPMLPWRLFKDRALVGIVIIRRGFFLTGPAVTILYIELPQRFQTVNGYRAIQSGLRVLAFGVGSPVGAICCTILAGRLRTPFVYLTLVGSVLQIAGSFLLSSVPTTINVWPGQYGYMAMTGMGTGISIAALYMSLPVVVSGRDLSIAMGLTLQARMLGASLGVAIVNSILVTYVKGHLSPADAAADPNHLVGFPVETQDRIRTVYASGYNLQMYAVGAFGAAQLFAAALMWKKNQVRFVK